MNSKANLDRCDEFSSQYLNSFWMWDSTNWMVSPLTFLVVTKYRFIT